MSAPDIPRLQALAEEADALIAAGKWTKAAFDRLWRETGAASGGYDDVFGGLIRRAEPGWLDDEQTGETTMSNASEDVLETALSRTGLEPLRDAVEDFRTEHGDLLGAPRFVGKRPMSPSEEAARMNFAADALNEVIELVEAHEPGSADVDRAACKRIRNVTTRLREFRKGG